MSLASLALKEKICKITFMKKSTIQFLYVTFPNQKVAKKISQMLIKQKLIACANILPKMTSIYMWNDKMEASSECLALFKTTKSKAQKTEDFILKNHPYKTPCVASFDTKRVNKAYKQWLLTCLEII